MKRPKRNTSKPPGLNPHDRFARKVMGDPLIAADILRHYTDPVVAKYVDLDNLRKESSTPSGTKKHANFSSDKAIVKTSNPTPFTV